MSETNSIISWDDNNPESREKAFSQFSEASKAYDGISKGNHRTFLDIESNVSVRPGYTTRDYHAFRPGERVPSDQKAMIKMCMEAYDKVGIVRNIIDLMGDFGSQGVSIVHDSKSVEKFYKQWFRKIDGKDRSERFLNNLYRTGQVFIYRSNAKITPKIKQHIRSMASDIKVQVPRSEKNLIPWRYNFFNPLTIDFKDGDVNLFLGRKKFEINAGPFVDNFKDGAIPSKTLELLPPDIKSRLIRGDKKIPLDPERLCVHYYKKDDWQQWANPITYAILDDIVMLEKMRLADLSALDGAISNIRLWTLGNLELKILPTKEGVDKLRNILAANVGGGTMELVYGPELTYTESNSQVYKFLGPEKYESVLNSIYAGLGVPPTLTGMANNGGGFTNNFISLKTLVERLQYGRDQLVKFWSQEVEIVRRAMGFRKAPHIVFDQMSLSDEAAEKNLLIQLADRDVISYETILERFKEIPSVEKVRLNREAKDREANKMPEKAGPFHQPEKQFEFEKMDKQHEFDKVTKKMDIDAKPKPVPTKGPTKKPLKKGGRPSNTSDKSKRKRRVDTPKSKPGLAEVIVWANESFDGVSDSINKAYLTIHKKKNMRQLTKAEIVDLEIIKLHVFTNLEIMETVTDSVVAEIVSSDDRTPVDFKEMIVSENIDPTHMSIDDYKKHIISTYIEYIFS